MRSHGATAAHPKLAIALLASLLIGPALGAPSPASAAPPPVATEDGKDRRATLGLERLEARIRVLEQRVAERDRLSSARPEADGPSVWRYEFDRVDGN
jgi:hypothetical protein